MGVESATRSCASVSNTSLPSCAMICRLNHIDQYYQFTGSDRAAMEEQLRPQAMKTIQTRLVLEKVAEVEDIQISDEKVNEEIAKMAEAYKMTAEKLNELMGDYEKEQMKKDLAVQEAVTLLADAAKVTEVVENKEA